MTPDDWKAAAPGAVDAILQELAQLRARVELTAPPGRERSLALTKLDEARHWTLDAFGEHR
jgi:hypothetical protein